MVLPTMRLRHRSFSALVLLLKSGLILAIYIKFSENPLTKLALWGGIVLVNLYKPV